MNVSKNTILNSLDVPIINSFEQLAQALSISNQLLYFLSFHTKNYYTPKAIPKKNGLVRQLYAPSLPLKVVQRWVLVHVLEKIKVSPQAMAFVPKRNGLRENAELHKGHSYILEMDLSNFFDTIQEKAVYYLFCNIGYNPKVATTLTKLCTLDGKLPQGAVTSPYIANLVAFQLDVRLQGLCGKRNIVYTRYADDLSFSSDDRASLNKIEATVKRIIRDEGFRVNDKKTRYLSDDRKMTVAGITINQGEIHVEKAFKKELRYRIYKALTTGDYSEIDKIRGSVSYVDSIEAGYKNKMLDYINHIMSRSEIRSNGALVDAFNQNKIFKELPEMFIK